jgi:hypothetical protein
MNRFLQSSLAVLALTAAVAVGALGYFGSLALRELAGAGTAAKHAGDQVSAAVAAIDGPHGTITMANEDVGALKSLIVHADLVARHEQQQLGTFDGYGRRLFGDFDGLARQGDATLAAAAKTAGAAGRALDAVDTTAGAAQKLLAAGTQTVGHADTAVVSLTPEVERLLAATGDTVTNANGVMADGRKVADKAAAEYLTPKPWWKKITAYAGDGFDITAFLARHY